MAPFGTPPTTIRAMLAGFSAIGLDGDALRRQAGLTDELLADPDRYVPAPIVFGLWRAATEHWARPGLGLHTGAAVPFGAYEVMDYLAASAPTLGHALRTVARYFSVGTLAVRYEIDDDDPVGPIRFRMVVRVPHAGAALQLRDYSVSLFANRIRYIVGSFDALSVELAGDALAPPALYTTLVGHAVSHDAVHTAICFSRKAWNRELARADASLQRTLTRHADNMLTRVPDNGDIVDQVVRTLVVGLRSGSQSIDDVARQLGMSARTLQRRLREGKRSFAEVVDDVRAGLAREYLADPSLSVTDVACLLGYSEATAFHRAFKRWTGQTPGRARARR
jgi:AraC-like DNA-binding protein